MAIVTSNNIDTLYKSLWSIYILFCIPVTIPQSFELVSYDTLEGRSQLAAWQSVFQEPTNEQINVVRFVAVDLNQLRSH